MAVEDRHTDRGGIDPYGGILEDLPGLPHYLHLLARIAIILEPVYLRHAVEGNLLRDHMCLNSPGSPMGQAFAAQQRDGLLDELLDSLTPGAGYRLVSGHVDALDSDGVVNGLERYHELNGRAVGIRDDIAVFVRGDGVRIDFRDNQRHVVVVTELGSVVDDDATGGGGFRRVFTRDRGARRKESDVGFAEVEAGELLDGQATPLEIHALPERAVARQEMLLGYREVTLFEHLDHCLTH